MADLFAEKRPLVIDTPEGGRRLVAELFPAQDYLKKDGVIYFDIGWYGSSAHPVHFVPGTIEGEGPWKIPEAGAEMSLLQDDDELKAGWILWQEFLASPQGAGATRAFAEQLLKDGAY